MLMREVCRRSRGCSLFIYFSVLRKRLHRMAVDCPLLLSPYLLMTRCSNAARTLYSQRSSAMLRKSLKSSRKITVAVKRMTTMKRNLNPKSSRRARRAVARVRVPRSLRRQV